MLALAVTNKSKPITFDRFAPRPAVGWGLAPAEKQETHAEKLDFFYPFYEAKDIREEFEVRATARTITEEITPHPT